MALRKIATFTSPDKSRLAKVYRDAEWQEWRVKHFQDGEYHDGADYHSTYKDDVLTHAKTWTNAQR